MVATKSDLSHLSICGPRVQDLFPTTVLMSLALLSGFPWKKSISVLHLPPELVNLRSSLTQGFIEVANLLLSSFVSHFVLKSLSLSLNKKFIAQFSHLF